ncbi:MAG: fused MFS/spermidine synthase [Alphaproteobacteria bacterium]
MTRYEALVFCTGAVTLSLELLASRIMTPYFGVSLYIWTGILAITLTFLAVGYRYGGKLSQAAASERDLEVTFLAAPIYSALAIALSVALYPALFPYLSQADLIVGSFLGAAILLALPLIMLSALNPLLIGLQREKANAGDAGAGRIFFISTIGSVVGVLLTAFIFIPNATNYRAMLILGLILCVMVVVFTQMSDIKSTQSKLKLTAGGLIDGVFCAILLVGKTGYLALVSSTSTDDLEFTLRAEYTSMFGNIKVADVRRRDGAGIVERYFIQDGLIQNRTTLGHQSLSMYTHVLQSLAHSYAPKARKAIVLGLGAGMVPRHFLRDGLDVALVEINPKALEAAVEHFGFSADGIDFILQDARTYVRNCQNSFDIAILDLFQGDSTPDYLLTKEFFADLRRCLKKDGVLVMNTILDAVVEEPNKRLMATIASAFPGLFMSGFQDGNILFVGKSNARNVDLIVEDVPMPEQIALIVRTVVLGSKFISPGYYEYSKPVSDDQNIFSILFSDARMAARSYLVGYLPSRMLVN